jgi:hypothetical protein
MPQMMDYDRECFTGDAFKAIGDTVIPATGKTKSMIDAWPLLTRLALPDLALDLVFPNFAVLVHPDLDATPGSDRSALGVIKVCHSCVASQPVSRNHQPSRVPWRETRVRRRAGAESGTRGRSKLGDLADSLLAGWGNLTL